MLFYLCNWFLIVHLYHICIAPYLSDYMRLINAYKFLVCFILSYYKRQSKIYYYGLQQIKNSESLRALQETI